VRDWAIIFAGAVFGAMLGVAIIFAAAIQGLLPHSASGSDIRAYLMSHPELVGQMSDLLQEKQQAETDRTNAATLKKIGMAAFFDPRIAFVTGPADAKNSLVEFYDYDCPYCRASLPAMMKFYVAHKNDTRFSFIEFPIPQLHGSSAVLAARASLAARLQPDKYMLFHFALMSEQGAVDENAIFADAQKVGVNVAKLKADMQSPEIEKAIDLSRALAQKAGIDGTPTFIANGVMHPGVVDDQTLNDMAKTG
jgi:protein-disulfide isomerase